MVKQIIKYRRWIILLSVAITVGLSASLFKLEIDPNLKHYFPKSMTSMVNTDRIEEIFGNQDMVMMVFTAGDILEPSTLERVKEVDRVQSGSMERRGSWMWSPPGSAFPGPGKSGKP